MFEDFINRPLKNMTESGQLDLSDETFETPTAATAQELPTVLRTAESLLCWSRYGCHCVSFVCVA